jgi:predicted phosphodiesterase
MRALVVSDIHANLAALQAVLADAGEFDAIWCLGDSVGYGPQPNEVLQALAEACVVLGNHDAAAAGLITVEDFNPYAAEAALWTAGALQPDGKSFIETMPETRVDEPTGFTLVHGSLRYPIWEYLLSADSALAHLQLQTTPYSLVGHSHIPMRVEESGAGPRFSRVMHEEVVKLGETRLVLNPGSVGQPRDGDPRASYGIVDTGVATFTLRRVAYDIVATQRRMAEAGLPERLILRLAAGR